MTDTGKKEARSIAQKRIASRIAMLTQGHAETRVTDAQKQMIVQLLEHGATFAEIETLAGMPSSVTIWRECRRDAIFAQAVDDARVTSAANILDEAQHQLRQALESNDPDQMRVAAAYAQGCTAYAEKIAPKQFGQLVKHAGADGGALVIQTVNYGAIDRGELHAEDASIAREIGPPEPTQGD